MADGKAETKIIELEVCEGKPILVDFEDFASAVFDKITVENVDKNKPTKLIVEYDDIQPESIDQGEIKVNRVSDNLFTFANELNNEIEIAFHADHDENTKFIVEGPGKVVIHGKLGPQGFFLYEDSEEEEEEEEKEANE